MKKIALIIFVLIILVPSAPAFPWHKKEKPVLIMSPYDPREFRGYDAKLETVNTFRAGDRIYFGIYTKEGFKSDYIKYQIVKQDDNANSLDAGYTRIRNVTAKVQGKNYFVDYFVLHRKGQYYLQIFDIENLQQWLALAAFRVIE